MPVAAAENATEFHFRNLRELQTYVSADFERWIKYRCSRRGFIPAAKHLELARWMTNGRRRKVCMGWRGCAKTDWLIIEYIMWRWLRVPETKVIVWCVKPDSPVMLPDGAQVKIGSLQQSDLVLSGSGNPRIVTKTFKRVYSGRMVRLRVRGLPDPIEMTPEHRVPTLVGWKDAAEISSEDWLVDPTVSFEEGGDYELGWIVGLYAAEGHRQRGPHGNWNETGFTVAGHEADFVHAAMSEFCDRPISIQRPSSIGGTALLRTSDTSLREIVDGWVIGDDCLSKRLACIPSHRETARGILDGWFYGDGWVASGIRHGQSSSMNLARQMMLLASSLGYSSNMQTGLNRPGPRERAAGMLFPQNRWWRVSASERWGHYRQTKLIDGVTYRNVTSVETFDYDGEVCDITVEMDHTFISQGIVVSNCNSDTNAGAATTKILDRMRQEPATKHLCPRGQVAGKYFTLMGVTTEKGHSIRATGVESTVTSERADLICIDDIESDNQPEARYERILQILDEAENLLSPQGRLFPPGECPLPEMTQLLVDGQPHWTGSAYIPPAPDPYTKETIPHPLRHDDWMWVYALQNPDGSPNDVDGESSVPEIMSTEEMRRKQQSMRPSKWRLEWMLDVSPENAEAAVILLSHIKTEILTPPRMIMVVDPADGGACEWGVAIGGHTEIANHIYFAELTGFKEEDVAKVHGIDKEHETIGDLMWMHIFQTAIDWDVCTIYFEQNCHAAMRSCRRYLGKHGISIPIESFTEQQNKVTRIVNAWEIPVKSGDIIVHPRILQSAETVMQMTRLRHTRLPERNDRIDAGAKLINILLQQPASMPVTPQRNNLTDPVFGVGRRAYSPDELRRMNASVVSAGRKMRALRR